MKIQVIGKETTAERNDKFTVTTLQAPKSLDEFDVNVIDLSEQRLWRHRGDSTSSIDQIRDFASIRAMVERKTKSKVIFLLPQNSGFSYFSTSSSFSRPEFQRSIPLKDTIRSVREKILPSIFPPNFLPFELVYENTTTSIAGKPYDAAFFFDTNAPILTKSDCSDKITTIKLTDNDVYATTLNISADNDKLVSFLEFLFSSKKVECAPEWFQEITFFDDEKQKALIAEKQIIIENAENSIKEANDKLIQNNKYKSILYSNGDELVSVVFDILEQLLECDLSEFEDKRKEDFLIKTDRYTLIGEIKGVTSNVRSDNVAQIDNHYYSYLDDHSEADKSQIHQILIINPLRKQRPDEREPVHINQIQLAERNGCLIIETNTLLRLFEQFKAGRISSKQCEKIFCNTTGLLDLNSATSFISDD